MKLRVRFLCLLGAGVVLATTAFFLWDHTYNTPDVTYAHGNLLIQAGYNGTAPEDFAGALLNDGILYVTRDSLHSLEYWQKMCPVASGKPFTSLRRVRYSLNEAAQSWREIRACFEQEWKQEKSYRVQAMLMLDEELGYRVFLSLEGRDTEAILEELRARYGELVQPWNDQASLQAGMMNMSGSTPGYEWLRPLEMKSSAYYQNETLYNQGKGEAP